jgi:hypothetical protein
MQKIGHMSINLVWISTMTNNSYLIFIFSIQITTSGIIYVIYIQLNYAITKDSLK